jgi:murein DD-endopeptidase MepM/ murein hydrolase activator NlpD
MDHLQALERMLRDLPLVAPVDDYRVSSPFGRRPDPVTGEWAFHEGIDIPGDERTPVRATAPGTVVFAGEDDQYGFLVEVEHGNGVRTRYGHLYKALVRQGQRVRYRERIALMGSTGRSTGPHLHYEVIVDGKPRDPMNFIQAGKYIFKR